MELIKNRGKEKMGMTIKYRLNKSALEDKLKENNQFVLCREVHKGLGLRELDSNFTVYDLERGLEYLIDSEDVFDTYEEVEEYGGILRSVLFGLEDMDEIILNAWKIYDIDRTDVTEKIKMEMMY